MPARILGRLADYLRDHEVTMPFPWCINVDSLAVGTHDFYLSAPEAGWVRFFSARCNLNGGTNSVDILVNGSSILAAAQALTTNTLRTLEGVGPDTAGEDRDFNTVANVNKLRIAKGDIIQVRSTVATAASLDFNAALVMDLRQPRTKPDRS